ncbi:MAG: SRPBCC family protein [bacterium]|nr:SRPBCC family protein [bacterium]
MNDRIEKQIEIAAPVARVWKALTDHTEFGQWFRVKLDAPFTPGQTTRGNITYPGYEHLVFEAAVQKMEAPRFFSYTWHPYPSEPDVDYSKETPTLVEFTLTEMGKGTLLTVVESGFDRIPAHRRDEAFRMNDGGWAEQMRNISAHVTASK